MIDDRLNGDSLTPQDKGGGRFGARGEDDPTPPGDLPELQNELETEPEPQAEPQAEPHAEPQAEQQAEQQEARAESETPGESAPAPDSKRRSRKVSDTSAVDDLSPDELRHALEAVLFSAKDPIPVRQLSDLFSVSVHDVREAVEALREEYLDTGRSFRVEDIAGGVQILTLPAYGFWIRRFHRKQVEGKLSPASLETLAVIAYKQPITRAELESIRGVGCDPTLKTLLDRGMIQIVGKDDSLGRPLLYGTTRRFLESFGLANLRELPQPEAFTGVFGESST